MRIILSVLVVALFWSVSAQAQTVPRGLKATQSYVPGVIHGFNTSKQLEWSMAMAADGSFVFGSKGEVWERGTYSVDAEEAVCFTPEPTSKMQGFCRRLISGSEGMRWLDLNDRVQGMVLGIEPDNIQPVSLNLSGGSDYSLLHFVLNDLGLAQRRWCIVDPERALVCMPLISSLLDDVELIANVQMSQDQLRLRFKLYADGDFTRQSSGKHCDLEPLQEIKARKSGEAFIIDVAMDPCNESFFAAAVPVDSVLRQEAVAPLMSMASMQVLLEAVAAFE